MCVPCILSYFLFNLVQGSSALADITPFLFCPLLRRIPHLWLIGYSAYKTSVQSQFYQFLQNVTDYMPMENVSFCQMHRLIILECLCSFFFFKVAIPQHLIYFGKRRRGGEGRRNALNIILTASQIYIKAQILQNYSKIMGKCRQWLVNQRDNFQFFSFNSQIVLVIVEDQKFCSQICNGNKLLVIIQNYIF